MNKLQFWDVIELKKEYQLVGTTWVFKIKKNHLNKVIKYKARVCAQGYTKTNGIDFFKTYAPTGRLNSLRTLISYSVKNNLEFHQIDIKSAFLNASLSETVYLTIPQGLNLDPRKQCLRLNKEIYRLKKAPLARYQTLKDWLNHSGYTSCTVDLSEFDIKDIGIADLILGIKINHHEDGVLLDQHHFVEALLELYGMSQCKTVTTPTAIRPDPSFEVSILSQYLEKPGIKHWSAFLHVLKYLKGSQELGLLYKRSKHNRIEAYSDADWGNCRATRSPVTSYLAKFNDCTILWKSRKQPMVSISTAEAKYKALCDLMSELLWLKQWCEEAKILKTSQPIIIWDDDQSCINIAKNDCNFNNKRLKHVDIQLHFIKEIVKAKTIILNYKPTKEILSNFLMKSINRGDLTHSLELLGLRQLGERGSVKQ
ncbi:hypothetical protein O181_040997 [Austropuccinia psidii MF-1]|uniref:Reverse transcriptase Ty1/copia-type domain-containing protein n=1 Tax=Austropuccinia psidii MF-1 TaxID=1389203 RepID=A0A9Q3HEF2_9BASI|nr:hypothetical protein [Austropuccinia psidii MF-1]